ncbi:hypothetical protein [Methanobrevibacter sp.]|uniref:hypothetical protein n=1 Tax=Methanobrevibacter sp. TaxID=66852 RepID=UPI0025DC2309|nr:hypothetical protein [Methanobrevibacter sp.]MBR4448501.1 hypothetical protein [Methanobrevibacter sp.]
MNIKDRILELYQECTNGTVDINKILLTIITKYQLFEPCAYLSEDEEWVDVVIVSLESKETAQPLCIKKSEITSFGIFRHEHVDAEIDTQKESEEGSEDLYQ